ncbi:unnamed protein product [Mycena citricolor]|uniref:Uncharacterized protein n=1 Tax=Mycena citricolor TaxID=2018698 RepID=A0AAD2HKL8_9AGAR|nr:unnamed protein product [Mycena citricolor]CAK5276580.1 unnamed protein product [Mycena citricolor]
MTGCCVRKRHRIRVFVQRCFVRHLGVGCGREAESNPAGTATATNKYNFAYWPLVDPFDLCTGKLTFQSTD